MRHLFPALILSLLSACAAGAPSRTLDELPGPVTYEVSSWGRLITRWQVNPDGSGEIWRGTGLGKGEGRVSKYRMTMTPEALRAFTAAVEPIRAKTAKGIACRNEITDMPYGSITWDYPSAKQSYRFEDGCRSPAADAVAERLRLAHGIVEQFAKMEAEPYATDAGRQR